MLPHQSNSHEVQLATYDVCIIGTGRVGLPLGLSMVEAGIRAVGVDLDPALRAAVNGGRMPFAEPGYDEIVARREFLIEADPAVVERADAIVITVGTPLQNHIEADLSQIHRVLEQLRPHLRRDQLLCLRSTVGPGTTQFVRKWIERHTDLRVGVNLWLAFCPERIAEGKAHEELQVLPQIVGAIDDESSRRARELFARLTAETLPTDFATAELVKLFNNILRYVHFALANQFALIAEDHGANIHETRRLANHGYPRIVPGRARTDRGHLPAQGLRDAQRVEPLPRHAPVGLEDERARAHVPRRADRQADEPARQSRCGAWLLVQGGHRRPAGQPGSQVWRYVHRQLPVEIRVSDHNLPNPIPEPSAVIPRNWNVDEALGGAGVVFIATNHTGYREALQALATTAPDTWIADIWNVGETDQIFYQARELLDIDLQESARALLTGGSGFLGSALCRDLVDAGHEVVALDDNSRGRASA